MGETPTPIAPCKKGFDFSKLSLVLKVPREWLIPAIECARGNLL